VATKLVSKEVQEKTSFPYKKKLKAKFKHV
jgi:hypothetical protein